MSALIQQDLEIEVEEQIEAIIRSHFRSVREKVDEIYKCYFASSKAVIARHWHNKKDIPKDIGHLPINIYQVCKKTLGFSCSDKESMSGKDTVILEILTQRLLQFDGLDEKIQAYLENEIPDYAQLEEAFYQLSAAMDHDELTTFLNKEIQKINIPREGGREIMVFIILGVMGKSLSANITFGSSLGLGSAMATSLYVSQQSWLSALWLKVAGVPAWVGVAGAATGLFAALLAAPVVAPFSELLINRLRGPKYLHNIVDQVEAQCLQSKADKLNLAGYIMMYVQALPDLVQALRMLR